MTRNFLKSWLFAPLKKPVKLRVFFGSKIEYFVVLSVSSFQKFLEEMRNHIHGELSEWSKVRHSKCCVPKKEPRVRIPNSPPKKSEKSRFFGLFFLLVCSKSAQNYGKNSLFLERTRRFWAFWRIRTVKISSFRHQLKFRPICCRNSPIWEAPFR